MAATRKSSPDPLSAYRAKRSADRTPEPSGTVAATPGEGGLFVVHQHAATRLHYDLRLEVDGVLRSWAVPKGPSRNPADKRLAVFVEDHPLEYGDFEGVIPEGNYGAGQVIVWDRGQWVPLNDFHEGLEKGKLLLELRGYKLKGKWTLVKLKKTPKEWLLIKERDGHVAAQGDDFPPGSVLSGLTVEDLARGATAAGAVRDMLKQLKAPRRAVRARDVTPMLAETRESPFSRAGWVFELKLDGYRLIASKEQGVAKLASRNGLDYTATFPEVAKAIAALPFDDLIVDGELVVLGPGGIPSFQRLQQRAQLKRPQEIRRGAVELPASLYLFDCMAALGHDLRELGLTDRKAVLRRIVPAAGALRYSDHFDKDGERLYAHVERMGLEGIMAKKADSPYRSRRSADWLKVRADRVDDFVVVGFSAPKGSRSGFGALHLAQYADGKLVYSGRAGSGFSDAMLGQVKKALDKTVRPKCPCEGPVPKGAGEKWVEPSLVAEVRFKEWTDEGLLRQPVFLRFREDKEPEECVRREAVDANTGLRIADDGKAKEAVPAATGGAARASHPQSAIRNPTFNFSNLEKVFWKQEGYTKGDLIEYYRAVAPYMLPYLKDRCLVLTRYPDGPEGKSFYQKDAPDYAHDFVRTVAVWSEDSQRELSYFVVEHEDELAYIANMAAIPLHIWHSRVATLAKPDWCVIDLDPKGAPFTHVVEVALACHELCEEIGLPNYAKTTGSSGLHVLLPLGRQVTYEQSRTLGGLIGRALAMALPDITTLVRQISKREGKVYVDYMQNGHGKLIVAPFSVRPVPGARVSAPLDWKEVTPRLDMMDYTIKTMPERMKSRMRRQDAKTPRKGTFRADPLLPVLEEKPDLGAALEKLHARFAARGKAKAKR